MRRTTSPLSAIALVVVLSTAPFAVSARAIQREGPGRDDPIVRVIKQLLKKLGAIALGEPGVPHP